jgi:hypothetical protein
MTLIEAASAYAETGKYDAETDGKMRRVRVITSALQAAVANVNINPPMTMSPLPPAPVTPPPAPVTPPPAPAAAPGPTAPRVQPRR